jgi:4-amino-4-deoxy-L-arabinose transferase-like glycosyltransferase
MKTKNVAMIVGLIAACHFLLATLFAMRTPYRQAGLKLTERDASGGYARILDIGAPDERQHANYIRFVLKNHSKPKFEPKRPDFGEEYQSHQPVLFYSLASTVARISGSTDVENVGFGQKIRLLNAFIGALGVIGAFLVGLWGTGRRDFGYCVAAFQAFLPMNCALSGAISNDPLLITLCTWSLALWFRTITINKDFRGPWAQTIVCGMFAGLAAATKTHGVAMILVGAMLGVYALVTKKAWAKHAIIATGIALLVPLPHYVSNTNLYGDPFGQKVFKDAFMGSAQKVSIVQAIEASGAPGSPEVQYWLNWIGYWTARSFIGVFGYMDIWLNESSLATGKAPNWLYKAVILLNFGGLVTTLAGLRPSAKKGESLPNLTIPLCILLCAVIVLFFIGFCNTYFQAQGRYLFPALPAFGLLLSVGWTKWLKNRPELALLLIVVVFGGISLYAINLLPAEFARRM